MNSINNRNNNNNNNVLQIIHPMLIRWIVQHNYNPNNRHQQRIILLHNHYHLHYHYQIKMRIHLVMILWIRIQREQRTVSLNKESFKFCVFFVLEHQTRQNPMEVWILKQMNSFPYSRCVSRSFFSLVHYRYETSILYSVKAAHDQNHVVDRQRVQYH